MKKNDCQLPSMLRQAWRSKFFRIMRLTCLLIVLSIIKVFPESAYSQEARLSMNLKNVTVRTVLQQIEEQSQFFFIYDATETDVDKRVSLEAKNELITNILDELFAGTNTVYKINNRQIALTTGSAVSSTESVVLQQAGTVTGRVSDSSGAPLPGVTVVVKGTTNGTITDFNGNYTLANVPENGTLIFSFVGMRTQELAVGGRSSINVDLIEETIGLDEVVAIGYGTQRKEDITSAISSVKAENFVTVSSPDAAQHCLAIS